jgi:Tol biopolymer transport system component
LDAITDWSRDGRFLLYGSFDKDWDLWILPLEGDRKPFAFLATNFREEFGTFSPDSRWIAYTSNESGRDEIYVRDFSGGSQPSKGKWHISPDEGRDPRWRSDGRELYFVSQRKIVSVALLPATGDFRIANEKVLLEMPMGAEFFDVSADGQRILLGLPAADTVVEPITVVLNWHATLKP